MCTSCATGLSHPWALSRQESRQTRAVVCLDSWVWADWLSGRDADRDALVWDGRGVLRHRCRDDLIHEV